MTPGPFGVIFASFVPFFFDMPISTRFKVFGVRFSDKSFVYLAGLQVMALWCGYPPANSWIATNNVVWYLVLTIISLFGRQALYWWLLFIVGFVLQLLLASWKFSFIPGICGLLAGFVYRSNLLGVKGMKVRSLYQGTVFESVPLNQTQFMFIWMLLIMCVVIVHAVSRRVGNCSSASVFTTYVWSINSIDNGEHNTSLCI